MSSEQPRLLILGPGSRSGGAINYIREAVPRIAVGWDGPVHIALPRSSIALLPRQLASVSVTALDRPRWARGPLHILPSTVEARRVIRRFDPHVILTLGNFAYSGPRRPTVVVLNNAARLRDLRWPGPSMVLYVVGLRLLYWVTAMRATRALAASQHLKGILPRPLRSRRTAIVHDGVALPNGTTGSVRRHDPGRLRLLLPGSTVHYRGIERVLEGLVECDADGLEVRIAGLEGSRSYRRRVQNLAQRLGLAPALRWLGHLTQEQLWDEMSRATHVVISSRVEACPNSLLEAALIDPTRPILAFADAWSEEFAALLDARVEPGEFLEQLLATADGSSAAVNAARRRALDGFSWDRSAEETLEVLRDVAAVTYDPR